MEIAARLSPNLTGGSLPVQGPPAPVNTEVDQQAKAREHEGLVKAAREFETVFLNQLMQAMRKTVPDHEMFNSKGPTRFYQQMQDAEMAKALATSNGGLGIADLIVQQLSPQSREGIVPTAGRDVPLRPAPRAQTTDRAVESYRKNSRLDLVRDHLKRLQAKAQANHPAAADTLRRYESEFHTAARESGLAPELLLAVVMAESSGDPQATSPSGAQGLMQLMPATAQELGVVDRRNPEENLRGGARYLSGLLDRYDGELPLALAAYNAGPGRVEKAGRRIPDIGETRNYVEKVTRLVRELGYGTDLAIEAGKTQARGSSTE